MNFSKLLSVVHQIVMRIKNRYAPKPMTFMMEKKMIEEFKADGRMSEFVGNIFSVQKEWQMI